MRSSAVRVRQLRMDCGHRPQAGTKRVVAIVTTSDWESRPVDYLNDWHGHDALIEGVAINIPGKSVSIRLLAYPNENSKDRKPIEFTFLDVESITASANLDWIAVNSSAGTVNHWHLAEGPGTSFFYLIEGYVAVAARSALKLEEREASSQTAEP